MMNIAQLVGRQLGLSNVRATDIHFIRGDLVTFVIKNSINGVHYIVYVVQSAGPFRSSKSALAAYCNLRYFHEKVAFEKLAIPVDNYVLSMQVQDSLALYHCLVTASSTSSIAEAFTGGGLKYTLELEDILQVAKHLSILHASCLSEPNTRQRCQMDRNTSTILESNQRQFQHDLLEHVQLLCTRYRWFFRRPDIIQDAISALQNTVELHDSTTHFSVKISELNDYPVLCHGFLTYQKLTYNETGQLLRISDWKDVHFGNICEDLSFLLITSASPETRRQQYRTIFRHYYYSLVDLCRPCFKILELEQSFLQLHKFIVFVSLPFVVSVLQASSNVDDEKRAVIAARWEAALEDALMIEKHQSLEYGNEGRG